MKGSGYTTLSIRGKGGARKSGVEGMHEDNCIKISN